MKQPTSRMRSSIAGRSFRPAPWKFPTYERVEVLSLSTRHIDLSAKLAEVLVTNSHYGMIAMTNSDDRPPPAVGAYWINEEDYPALLRIFTDGNKMPRTWKEWLKMAEEMERGLKAYGHVVMRVRIDPNTFPDWCAAHGTSPGREGRKRFVAAAVTERYGNQD